MKRVKPALKKLLGFLEAPDIKQRREELESEIEKLRILRNKKK